MRTKIATKKLTPLLKRQGPKYQSRADSKARGDCGVFTAQMRRRVVEEAVRRSEDRRPAATEYLESFLCAWLTLCLLATGCTTARPLKGGSAVTVTNPSGILGQAVVQGENAAQATKQAQESLRVRSYTLPAGSRLEEARVQLLASGARLTNVDAIIVSAPMPVVERDETRAQTELGAAQKDVAREVGARLSSLKGVVWVGLGLAVFGLASLLWPPLKALIGSVTTGMGLMLGGVALMVLPSLVVGNELLILGIVAAAIAVWFLAHRHGQLRGLLAAGSGNNPGDTSTTNS